jgi:hypothetical protein
LLVNNILALKINKLAMNFSSSFPFRVKKIELLHEPHIWRDFESIRPFYTHCEHTVAMTVAGELSSVMRFISLRAALPFLTK